MRIVNYNTVFCRLSIITLYRTALLLRRTRPRGR